MGEPFEEGLFSRSNPAKIGRPHTNKRQKPMNGLLSSLVTNSCLWNNFFHQGKRERTGPKVTSAIPFAIGIFIIYTSFLCIFLYNFNSIIN